MQSPFSPFRIIFLGTILAVVVGLLVLYWAQPRTKETILVGVMIDNHEDARPYHRGLEQAPLVMEHLVEGYITRFIAFFDVDDLPESVGPIRSVRTYFIDGSAPIISAIMHVGGSPEAMERLRDGTHPQSFNAILMDKLFAYDTVAPAPHHRFLLRENFITLIGRIMEPVKAALPLFPVGSFTPDEPAAEMKIEFYSKLHTIMYTYDAATESYRKKTGGELRPPSPANIVLLETDVQGPGEMGRLTIRMTGSGTALLFRDGGMQRGTWSKSGQEHFFRFSDATGEQLSLADGQVWMIVLDSLDRVTWK